ncbi:MAG: 2-oxo acid dehydrogenase subunit E2 [Eubacteriales bacterium]|nr:2-oxo acid dehydrogenase subunit E2 [Eubacteriales bacterium]
MKRSDGKRVKNISNMNTLMPYIMVDRSDACNSIELNIPLEPIREYLRQKRSEGVYMSHMGIMIAAVLRATAECPRLNRFVVNKRVYARNEFSVGMVVLRPKDAEETMAKLHLTVRDDIFTVQQKIDDFIVTNRKEDSNDLDSLMRTLIRIPGLLTFAVGLLKWLDKHNLMPKAVIEASPMHNSIVVTNLASIRTNHIYHHIYNFGTVGMIIAMGNTRAVPVMKGGTVVYEQCIPLGVVTDERICSGSYYGAAFQRIKHYLANPALLEQPPEHVEEDW